MEDITLDLNSPERYYEIRSILQRKKSLRLIYQDIYKKYADCIQRSPQGDALEIGSGAGFAKEVLPQLITSDAISYPHIDRIMDATHLTFPDESLACICMFNVLHHIPDTPTFFKEAARCLVPGGRVFMTEPYAGWFSSWIYKHLHHEGFDLNVKEWEFTSKGPLSDANNALPTIIFERDKQRFLNEFPTLVVEQFTPIMPLSYWMAGGLKSWSLLPQWAYPLSRILDDMLVTLSPRLGSFVDIELVKL